MACGIWDLSFPTRDWTQVSALNVLSPNHWTTRELLAFSLWSLSASLPQTIPFLQACPGDLQMPLYSLPGDIRYGSHPPPSHNSLVWVFSSHLCSGLRAYLHLTPQVVVPGGSFSTLRSGTYYLYLKPVPLSCLPPTLPPQQEWSCSISPAPKVSIAVAIQS